MASNKSAIPSHFVTFLAFTVIFVNTLSSSSFAVDHEVASRHCYSYLKQNDDGHPLGVTRIESLFGHNVEIRDVTDFVQERVSYTDKKLNVVDVSQIFSEGQIFLGFGKPNVYLAWPNQETPEEQDKFAAYSLYRSPSEILNTKNRVQSGIFVVFKNLKPEQIERIVDSAKNYVGTKRMTCVNSNCHVLSDSGFTVGGESMQDYYFPTPLLRDIIKYGIELDGEKIEFDMIRTTQDYLEDVGLSINKAVATTICRHAEKACKSLEKKAENNVFLARIAKAGRQMLGLLYIRNVKKEESNIVPREVYEPTILNLDPEVANQSSFDLQVSEPSKFGTLLRLFWGPHSLFTIPVDSKIIDSHLPDKLVAYPDEKPSLMTRLKKDFLFSPTVVKFIRSQMAKRFSTHPNSNAGTLFGMMRTHNDDYPNKYNIVIEGNKISVMKISIKSEAADWVLSKHVLVSGYSDDVRFAGEVWKGEDGVIYFSNNSGTYKPGDEQAYGAIRVLQAIFPGVAIRYTAPQL